MLSEKAEKTKNTPWPRAKTFQRSSKNTRLLLISMLMILSILLILMLFQFILMLYLYLRTVNDVTEGRPNQEIPVGNSWWFPSNSSGILWEISNGSSWWFSGNDSTVRPWHARFFGGNGKTCVAQNSCNLSYLQNYDKGKSIKKLCSLRFSLNNSCISNISDPIQKRALSRSMQLEAIYLEALL